MLGVRGIAELRQLRGAGEAIGEVLALLMDAVVDEARPGRDEVLLHEAHDTERSRPDDLGVDVALVHVVHVALGSLLEVFGREPRLRAGRRGARGFGKAVLAAIISIR